MSIVSIVFVLLSAFCLSGCGGDGFDRLEVAGTVVFDGAPVKLADISFIGTSTEPGTMRPQSFGRIVNGEFKIPRERGPLAGKQTAHIVLLEEVKREFDPSNAEEQAATTFRELGTARAEVEIPPGGTDTLRIELNQDSFKIATDGQI